MFAREWNRISETELASDKMSQRFIINLETGSDNSCSNSESANDKEISIFWMVTVQIFHTLV
jgi:hypothetical protein